MVSSTALSSRSIRREIVDDGDLVSQGGPQMDSGDAQSVRDQPLFTSNPMCDLSIYRD